MAFSLSFASAAHAEVLIETAVSRSRVAIGEELTLDIIVSNATGPISKPNFPPLDGFTSYSQGHSQELSIVNGQSSSRSIFSYVLIPNSTGKKVIGPFELTIGGKEFKVAPVEIEVVQYNSPSAGGGPMYSRTPVNAPPTRALPQGNVADQDIFVKAWLDKDSVYVNEPAMLTYTLYTRLSATYKGFDKEPVTTGFWVEDFPPEKTVKRTEQFLNGARFVVADVRKLALFPTQAGVFTLDPGVLAATVEIRDEAAFDSFFSYNVFGRRNFPPAFSSQIVPKLLPTDKIALTVKALPGAGKPSSFTGAVGDYRLESSVDKKEVEVGAPVTYRIRITGQGNVNTVQAPPFPKMEGFKIYDSSSSAMLSKDRLLVEGQKVTETVIVPKKAGVYTLPVLNFSYFDPNAEAYKELKTQPHALTVKPGPEGETALPEESGGVEEAAQNDVTLVGKDIRFIKTFDPGRILPEKELHRRAPYWALNFFLLLACAALSVLSAKNEKASLGVRGFRVKQSHRVARKKLKRAAAKLDEDAQDEFYEETSKAVYGYFADKLGIPPQNVSLETIRERIGDTESEGRDALREIGLVFDELSHGRFARARKSEEEMRSLYASAERAISSFEKLRVR